MLSSPASSGGAPTSGAEVSTRSSASMTPLPMPRGGTLMTRRSATSSCGFSTSFR